MSCDENCRRIDVRDECSARPLLHNLTPSAPTSTIIRSHRIGELRVTLLHVSTEIERGRCRVIQGEARVGSSSLKAALGRWCVGYRGTRCPFFAMTSSCDEVCFP